jgi:hypothetical protein
MRSAWAKRPVRSRVVSSTEARADVIHDESAQSNRTGPQASWSYLKRSNDATANATNEDPPTNGLDFAMMGSSWTTSL